jgi:copper(I)-binding protein
LARRHREKYVGEDISRAAFRGSALGTRWSAKAVIFLEDNSFNVDAWQLLKSAAFKLLNKDVIMRKHLLLLAGLAMLAAAGTAQAQEYKLGNIMISHPWTRPTPESAKVGAAYLSLENRGNDADTLVSATSPVSEKTEIHETIHDGDIMKMRPVKGGLTLAPGVTVKLEPGGYHVMLVGLKQNLDEGLRIPLTLSFAKAGSTNVEVLVEKTGSGQQESKMKSMDRSTH